MIVDPNMSDDELRRVHGDDADAIIAFRKFLGLPKDEDGRKVCPPHWYDYATGAIGSAEVLRIESEVTS